MRLIGRYVNTAGGFESSVHLYIYNVVTVLMYVAVRLQLLLRDTRLTTIARPTKGGAASI